MTAARWPDVERVYLAARECDGERRTALLDAECTGRPELRHEVEALLAQEPRADAFLESRPWVAVTPAPEDTAASAAARPMPPPLDASGLFAGRYRVVSLLGAGGMGVVYRAEDVRLRRPAALKFLAPHLSAEPRARRQFLREAQAAAALDDPHVCTVFEAGEHDGLAYIAMALIEGPTLKERLAAGPLPVAEAIAVARDVAAGLAAAHARGIVHRDIKPGNVLLGAGRAATITDFGLAKLEDLADSSRTTGTKGTPAYMSPEQVQGLRTDHRTDIWALGCVLVEMLTGRSPFVAASGQVDLFAIVHGDAPGLHSSPVAVPAGLAAIVERCLCRDLRRRYWSASEVLADLSAVHADPGLQPRALAAALRDAPPSIAVLPFADMSHDRSQQFFAEGTAEEIIHALSRVDGLRVVARTSSFAVKEKGLDVHEIGRVLNVDAVLEGSVRTAGSRLRVTAQLIDTADGCHLWSERFDREVTDAFVIQDEITASVVEHLRGALHVAERNAPPRSPVDPEVYALYLKGQYFFHRPSPEALQSALRYFTEASERAPSFARAHAGAASVWGTLANMGVLAPDQAWPKAKVALDRALALDEDLPEAVLTAGFKALWYDWDWTAAEACNVRSLALLPGDAYARGGYAWFLLNRRRFDECLAAVGHAIALDPLSPLLYSFSAGLHAATQRPEQALADYARSIELAPTFGLPRFHAAIAYTQLGQYAAALDTLDAGTRCGLAPGWADCIHAFAHARQGHAATVADIVGRMVRQRAHAPVSPACIAWASASAGDFDAAFQWFDRAFDEREGLMAWVHVYTDVFCPGLADDPRFLALLERMQLTDVAR